ncbi:putative formin [Trypanosoma rangeli]|uniref:Putative formin n=1 Tax=Trypanosoma rangeli TaxID=5698 RepID=A0A3R7MF82_TRYRA|nr:putative formin [Trypanosoma rangeli]RNF04738.1 putative formin [Trypanosoma rangeli]|eukprot:RNF04738.1 putative formin [Trypanosoma rangeli]
MKKAQWVIEVFLEPNCERNVGIILQFLRIPIHTDEASVRTFDELTLGEEDISGLAKIMSEVEDIRAINGWMKRNSKASTTRPPQMCVPVRFFMMGMKIRFYVECLQCWNLKNEFEGRIDDLKAKIHRTTEPPHLPCMLQFVLAISNVLNTGSQLQGAKGFRTTQLAQIIDFQTTNGRCVLLNHLRSSISRTLLCTTAQRNCCRRWIMHPPLMFQASLVS